MAYVSPKAMALKTMECVRDAAPEEHEGELEDGRKLYFRYRWGVVWLGIADTLAEARHVGVCWVLQGQRGRDCFDSGFECNEVLIRMLVAFGSGCRACACERCVASVDVGS